MSAADREKWDRKYGGEGYLMGEGPRAVLESLAEKLPTVGLALDVGCGEGQNAVWLAERGLGVVGLDVSPVGLEKAIALAEEKGVADRVYFAEVDLDEGLPPGLPSEFALITSLHFRPGPLMDSLLGSLAPGGRLLVEVLTDANDSKAGEGGTSPSPKHLAAPGELVSQTMALNRVWYREGRVDGVWTSTLLAEKPVEAAAEE